LHIAYCGTRAEVRGVGKMKEAKNYFIPAVNEQKNANMQRIVLENVCIAY
jgi:hypothetical protein